VFVGGNMVLPAKIFEIKEELNFGLIVQKLKDFREEESYEKSDGETVTLVTEILDLSLKENLISGIFSEDFMRTSYYRRTLIENPVTEEAQFWVTHFENQTFLVVVAPSVARGVKKLLTSHVANKLSKLLFITPRAIVETTIPHETLKTLHESNPQATRLKGLVILGNMLVLLFCVDFLGFCGLFVFSLCFSSCYSGWLCNIRVILCYPLYLCSGVLLL
jgi:hypothetical protein